MAARRPPTRSCVACRTARDKRDLLRVVRLAGGGVAVDPGGRQHGRGAYVCPDEGCITNAVGRGGLARALETAIPAALREDLAAAAPHLIVQGGARGQE